MRRPCVPNMTHESILILFKGDWVPREKNTGLSADAKSWLAHGVWKIGTEQAQRIGHQAPFPVELPDRCIQLFSLEYDYVLDPFLGSGTTIIAAHQNGRIGLGIEKLEKYGAVILERLSDLGLEPRQIT